MISDRAHLRLSLRVCEQLRKWFVFYFHPRQFSSVPVESLRSFLSFCTGTFNRGSKQISHNSPHLSNGVMTRKTSPFAVLWTALLNILNLSLFLSPGRRDERLSLGTVGTDEVTWWSPCSLPSSSVNSQLSLRDIDFRSIASRQKPVLISSGKIPSHLT